MLSHSATTRPKHAPSPISSQKQNRPLSRPKHKPPLRRPKLSTPFSHPTRSKRVRPPSSPSSPPNAFAMCCLALSPHTNKSQPKSVIPAGRIKPTPSRPGATPSSPRLPNSIQLSSHSSSTYFERTQQMDREITQINGAAPNSESRRIQSIAAAPILANTKLLALTGQPLWPPPTPPILPEQVMPVLPHPGPDWWRANQERDAERRAESTRVANFYANRARQREEREAEEARAARARNGGSP